jgi:hypothetical protein
LVRSSDSATADLFIQFCRSASVSSLRACSSALLRKKVSSARSGQLAGKHISVPVIGSQMWTTFWKGSSFLALDLPGHVSGDVD